MLCVLCPFVVPVLVLVCVSVPVLVSVNVITHQRKPRKAEHYLVFAT